MKSAIIRLLAVCAFLPWASATAQAGHTAFSTPIPAGRPVVVFDLDRTLFNIDGRVVAILRTIGATSISPEEARSRTSAFGKLFYHDASYLIHDTAFAGAAEFVATLSQTLGASILYLSARLENDFQQATEEQLLRHGLPPGLLILKPQDPQHPLAAVPTHIFKSHVLQTLHQTNPIVAIFDDSKRNVNEFRSALDPQTFIVHISAQDHAQSSPADLLPGIHAVDQLASHATQLIDRAQHCAQLLLAK